VILFPTPALLPPSSIHNVSMLFSLLAGQRDGIRNSHFLIDQSI
jgi:hypothetical protein